MTSDRPIIPASVDRLERIDIEIHNLCEAASLAGIGLSAWRDGVCLWVNEFDRDQTRAKPGTGRMWLLRLLNLAARQGMSSELCCTAWNSPLVAYYHALGFISLKTVGDELFMRVTPCPTSPLYCDLCL